MTNEETILAGLAKVESRLAKVESEIHELRVCVTGDKIHHMQGLMDVIEAQRKEIYGDEATRHVGLKAQQETNVVRIKSLEDSRVKVLAYIGAVSGTAGTVYAIVKALVAP